MKKNNEKNKTQKVRDGGQGKLDLRKCYTSELNSTHPDESRKATKLATPA